MSVTYGFYNSVSGDRKYNAKQMSEIFDGLIADGIFATQGGAMVVSAGGNMTVLVEDGRAWFDHTWTKNDSSLAIVLTASDLVLDRTDIIVLEVNEETRINTIKKVDGTPGSGAPALVDTATVHQYKLAEVFVGAGVTEILAENITNFVGTSGTPFVTGIIDTIDIDTLLLQWDGEFNTWFEGLQDILDENVAGNLLNLINANTAEIERVGGYVSTSRLNKDENGIYTEIQYYRDDATLYKKSVLSGGTSPSYTTRTVTMYEADGVTVKSTTTYTLSYVDDEFVGEVIV